MKYLKIILLISIILGGGCTKSSPPGRVTEETAGTDIQKESSTPTDSLPIQEESIPSGVKRLIDAYPDLVLEYRDNLVIINGEQITYDDGVKKSFIQRLDDCDIEDMFAIDYDSSHKVDPGYLSDPGRGRCEKLFKAIYGHNAKEVAQNLVTVKWFGQEIPFTRVNGANQKLQAVADELAHRTELKKYFSHSSSFYWRKVRGSNRQSAHSYGIAIDINVDNSDYWRWSNPKKNELDKIEYKNRIPHEIVEVFEKYGFIWGGNWYHFDTMHFEYRPELLVSKD